MERIGTFNTWAEESVRTNGCGSLRKHRIKKKVRTMCDWLCDVMVKVSD